MFIFRGCKLIWFPSSKSLLPVFRSQFSFQLWRKKVPKVWNFCLEKSALKLGKKRRDWKNRSATASHFSWLKRYSVFDFVEKTCRGERITTVGLFCLLYYFKCWIFFRNEWTVLKIMTFGKGVLVSWSAYNQDETALGSTTFRTCWIRIVHSDSLESLEGTVA